MIDYLVPCVVIPIELTWIARGIYRDYKKAEELRLKKLAEHDICICKHERWYHQPIKTDILDRKCYQFKEPQDQLILCGCPIFKMDNLLYLEKLVKERG